MRHRKAILFVSFFIIVIVVVLFIPYRTALVFYEENTDHIEAFLPIKSGETFQIIFKHSIHLTDVVEKYIVTADHDIKQYEMVYEEFGIGMPSNAGPGETFAYEDGKYHLKDLDNYFSSMNIRNGKTVSEHRLIWESSNDDSSSEKEYMAWFNRYFEPGAWFTVQVERLSLWERLKGVKIHEGKQ
ncbi:DUF1850 domain-containing protein [Virgibacillus sp. NKC19-16]|uniref:DUF1850 domain-containing protein n=1 Tax=Virgibacillus salidurans TaxID=2831673 RepID=UPI001F2013B3|nr:DUF1850 domain-containing protein [Virgibacillus sp. NKC19-16]UJL46134.1 DUF1850 domain-containing protein [Virgibacillus sp. NKC19-16]